MVKMAQYGTRHGHAAGKWRSMQANPNVEVVGIFEPDIAQREKVSKTGGAYDGAHWFESAEDMLSDESISAIASEGANIESLDQTEAIVEAGKQVWYDKPAGDNWAQWQKVIALAREKNVLVQMGYMFRYHDGYCKIAEWVHSGLLGDVFEVRAHMSTYLRKEQKQAVGVHRGGVFYDLSGHQLDQIVWLLGRPEKVTTFLRNDLNEVEGCTDNGVGIYEFERAIAILDIAALEVRPNARRFEVYGTKGSAIMEPMEPAEHIRLVLDEAREGFDAGAQEVPVTLQSRQDTYDLELESFVAAINGEKEPDRSYEHEAFGARDRFEGHWCYFRIDKEAVVNVICVMLDSLRADHVGAYGNRAKTPNMDRIASESLVFSKAYSGSFPTLPCRRDLFTGRWGQPFNTWDELERDLPTMAESFRRAGHTTGLIFDTPMFMTQGNFLDRGFGSIEWIRGQGGEPWISDEIEEIEWPARQDKVKPGVMRYLANQRGRLFEEDYLGPRVFKEAMHWLERNYVKDGLFMWIDSWDPHEPWDPPQYYVDMYDPGYEGDEIIYPCYGFSNYMTEKELNHVRALYAAEVTMTDRWLGMLWDTIEVLGLKKNTVFMVMADHGHYFGDHGLQGKPWADWGQLYEPMVHIPFMMYHPDCAMAGKQVDSLVQPVDVFPTMCDLAGLNVPDGIQGKSFADVLLGKTVQHREFAISGRNLNDSWGTVPSTITDGTWTLVYWPNKDLKYKGPKSVRVERYDCRNMPERRVDELFNMNDDPGQEKNVIADHPEEAKRLHKALLELIEMADTDPEIAKTYQPEPGNQYQ